MKNVYFIACLFVALFMAACSSTDTPTQDTSLAPANATKPVTPLTIADTLLSDSSQSNSSISAIPSDKNLITSVQPGKQPQITAVQPQVTASKGASGSNPAHGQPGHRCDIAVGAPLSSPANVATSSQPAVTMPQVQSSPSMTPVQLPAAKPAGPVISSGGSGKMNPPHGQPGHDCAVQVGAPLKN